MGLDIGTLGTPGDEQEGLLAAAESAIRKALDRRHNSISFSTAASYVGRENELAEACASLKTKFPALVEITPVHTIAGATVYLNKKPNALTRLVRKIATADM
jgi:hypothetical protein